MPLPERNIVMYVAGASSGGGGSRRPPVVVEALPEIGEYGVTYLVANGGTAPNLYDEYIWVSPEAGYELLGQKEVDLSHYVRDSRTINRHALTANVEVTYADLQDKPSVGGVTLSGNVPLTLTGDAAIAVTNTGTASAIGYSVAHSDSGVTAGSKGDTTAQTPGFGGTFKVLSATVDAKGHVTALADHTTKIPSDAATSAKDGLMSKTDKAKLDAIGVTASSPLEVTKTGETYNVTLKDSGVTAGSKGDTTNQTPGFGGTFKVLSATVDAKGRLSSLAEHSVKTPDAEATQSAKGLMSAADKKKLDNAVTGVKGDKESAYRTGNVNITPANIGAVPASAVGVANGVAELDSGGKVPSSQLPSYVDDVLEYAAVANFPATGESGKIYVATSTNLTYRWTGTGYAEISQSIALGETSSTAYRGDRGKTAYDHAQTTGNAHNMVKADIGLGNVDNTSDANKPVSTAQQAALDGKVDKISGKGLSTNDYTTAEKNKLSAIPADANHTAIDDTLSVAGDAADAKAAGDAVSALQAQNALLRELLNGIDADIYRTASGNPATFNDAKAANVKALSVAWTPAQSGSGDPSPNNVRPISGVSSVTLSRTGKNLFDPSIAVMINNYYDNDGVEHAGQSVGSIANYIAVTPKTAYVLSGRLTDGSNTIAVYFYDSQKNWLGRRTWTVALSYYPFVTPSNCAFVRFQYVRSVFNKTTIQLEPGTTVTVALVDSNNDPLTVYGGTLDVTTGTLTVTHGGVQVTGAESVNVNTRGFHINRSDTFRLSAHGGNNGNVFTVCDKLSSYSWNGLESADVGVALYYYGGIAFRNAALSTADEYRDWLAALQPFVVYLLETPVTYTLTPQQLATLAGYNAVSADAGTVSVTYKANPAISLGGG